ncbi:hypothetical protein [Burkholderia cenocepacia]|uniref:hypothetical protein n=1 Tax=Burkholderia cenocepacia TaxID=95486 RepID=UPI000F5BA347|nr:hypothetical protein [Burkholderia cenocepacia]
MNKYMGPDGITKNDARLPLITRDDSFACRILPFIWLVCVDRRRVFHPVRAYRNRFNAFSRPLCACPHRRPRIGRKEKAVAGHHARRVMDMRLRATNLDSYF